MAIIYVKSGATGNGSTWNNAYGSLASALTAAQAGDEIWVSAGTYKPTTGTDRTASFTLKNNVGIYGGFAGTETARNQRNITNNATILSGEIGVAGIADNVYHVVSATGNISNPLGNSSILDGFTITGGNANGTTGNQGNGGGVYVSGASPTLRNITFRDNNGTNGGALYNESGSNPVLIDTLFEYNTATRGAAIYNDLSSPQITDGTFRLNTAINDGGAIYNTSSSNPTIVNTVFSRNSANTGSGGAVFNNLSNPNFINSTFSNNVAITGGAFSNTSSSVAIRNSILYGNQNSSGTNQISGGGVTVANSIIQGGGFTGATDNDPLFVNANADDLRLKSGSPALNARKSHKIREWFNEFTHVLKKLGTITAMGATFWMLQGGMAKAATWNLTQTILNPTVVRGIDGGGFGNSIAISDNSVLVGAPYYDTGATYAGTDVGAAYLFDRITGSLLDTLSNPYSDTSVFRQDWFGYSVAISGNNVVVGAPGDDTGAKDAGAAYLFNATTGSLMRTFPNPTPGLDDKFGYSVAISGDNVLIGTPLHRDTAMFDVLLNAGAAYLFNATTGSLMRTFLYPTSASTPASHDLFGYSVAISGNNVLIGKPGDRTGVTTTSGTSPGAAYLFDATTGNLLQTFLNPTGPSEGQFGRSVAISGNNVLVGAFRNNTGVFNAGAAYLFNSTTGSLLQTFLNPTPADEDWFGNSVAISGNNVLVSASLDDTGATDAGAAYLFDATTGNLLHTFLNPTPGFGDQFGRSVAVSGNNVVVAAIGDSTVASNAGAAYLFQPAQQPPSSVPEGDNVVGLLFLAGGYGLKRVISRLLKR